MPRQPETKLHPLLKFKSTLRRLFLHIILYGIITLPKITYTQQQKYTFQHLSIEQGLSHPSVECILQDHQGILWIGTNYGLNRFDGQTFKIYSHDPSDSLSISANKIHCLYEDRFNTLWIGTANGLNRFDRVSETFTRFTHTPDDSTSLSAHKVWGITETPRDTSSLWIVTGGGVRNTTLGGLNKLDRNTGSFTRFQYDPNNPHSLSDNALRFILVDDAGFLWIGTWDFGLNRFDPLQPETPVFTHYTHDPSNPNSLSHNNVSSGAKDRSGALWFGTGDGLNKYDPKTGKFANFKLQKNNLNSRHSGSFQLLFIGSDGMIWMDDGMLVRFNPQSESFVHIKFSRNQGDYNTSYTPTAIYEDDSHNLWVGTQGSGLYEIDLKPKKYRHYKNEPDAPTTLSDNDVRIIHEDREGILWIATVNEGINRFDPVSETFTHFKHDSDDWWRPRLNRINEIFDDSHGFIWVGTDAGLYRIDSDHNRIVRFLYDSNDPFGTSSRYIVYSIYEDHTGTIWVGTFPGDLYKFDRERERFTRFEVPQGEEDTPRNDIDDICEDRSGNFWLSAWEGCYLFDRRSGTFTRIESMVPGKNVPGEYDRLGEKLHRDRHGDIWGFGNGLNTVDTNAYKILKYLPHSSSSYQSGSELLYNELLCLQEDGDGMFWCGSRMGLHKFDPQQRKFIAHYSEKDGLLSNLVRQIVEDDAGNLWLLTARGISIFNEHNSPGEQFRNLSAAEGILDNTPTSGEAFIKSRRGDIYWGGANGIYRFYPAIEKTNPHVPNVRITDFKIFNRSVKLDTAITEINTIRLDHNENFFSFSFAALDFTNPLQNQYVYKLEGVDEDWVSVGSKTEANYTNVSPGRYTFRVKGSNNDGVWNEAGVTVQLIITQPWWKTTWAYVFYVALLGLALYGYRRFEMSKIKLRNELTMRQFEAQKLQEVDQMKSRFFANISHEFRTPLTLILGPIEKWLADRIDAGQKEDLRMMQRSGLRLLQLINQLLDLSKLESGRMTLQTKREDIVVLLKGLVNSFASLAERRRITLKFTASEQFIIAEIDRDKLEKIVSNLLSNAFKFTPEGGSVTVAVGSGSSSEAAPSASANSFEIVVTDTGPGIPTEHLDKIFDRFYQIDDSPTRVHGGSGIGLALTKELVELHRGEIIVHSEVGKGTTFIVRLPLAQGHLPEDEITRVQSPVISDQFPVAFDLNEEDRASSLMEATTDDDESAAGEDATIILIVEDHRDVRTYIRRHLEPTYQVIEADDGADGVEKARETIPDLVISDVMMPKMDGYQLCHALKADEKTSHIPVILLTAKASSESKVEGLETGADDYLIKPFNSRELLARVKNLIRLRQRLRERFSREVVLKPSEIAVTPMDEAFLLRVKSVVEAHIDEEDFSVEQLGKEVGMSRTQIHRKLKALVNQSASRFIRSLRLQRAASLLKQNAGTVGEISYMVGFSDQAYFTKCFQEQFGCSPKEYVKRSL